MDSLTKHVAALKVEQLDELRASAGPKWGSERIPRDEALARMDEWDVPTPAILKAAAALSVSEAVQAALQAVRLRTAAMRAGEWAPPPGHGLEQALAHGYAPAPGVAPPLAPAPAAAPVKKKVKVKTPKLDTREDVGGERVLAGEAALGRQVAPGNPAVPVTVGKSELKRGTVLPRGA